MTERLRPYERVSAVGGVYDISDPRTPRCLGSCAALGLPTHFITAAHCVVGVETQTLAVNHFGHSQKPFSPVRTCKIFEHCDLAVLEAEVESPKWIVPFSSIAGATDMGEPVTAIGWPVDLISDDGKETLRVLRGFVQRPFFYKGAFGHQYSAYELSFPAPPGLSGSPIFSDYEPELLRGVVTENFRSFTVVESEETQERPGEIRRTESKEIVTYGVAVNPFAALEFLEDAIPAGNLNSAEIMSEDR